MREFAARAGRRVAPVPVRLCDERLTTVSAEAMLRDRGRKGSKRRAVVDQAAAVLILQHALDTERAHGTRAGRDRRGGRRLSDASAETDGDVDEDRRTEGAARRRQRRERRSAARAASPVLVALAVVSSAASTSS